jgi:hypothetical protein
MDRFYQTSVRHRTDNGRVAGEALSGGSPELFREHALEACIDRDQLELECEATRSSDGRYRNPNRDRHLSPRYETLTLGIRGGVAT